MHSLTETIIASYRERYGESPDVVALAPGRVNLIGEHTDYTGGFVLPVAIDKEVVVAAGNAEDSTITGYSIDFSEEASTNVGKYDPKHPAGWFHYVMGVLDELAKTGREVTGFRFAVGGNIPIGAGLSSSAAIEMAIATAMEGLLEFSMDDMAAALLCQRAENRFVGMNCGIMDQYISRVGKSGHAILIDCADLSIRPIPINLPGWTWLVIDSKKRRGLVDSEYNRRRADCEEGLIAARKAFPDRNLSDLRDLTVDDLDHLSLSCDPLVFRRVKHVVTENARVLDTITALDHGNADDVGRLLAGSHASLRDDFEVSCAEIDLLVDILSDVEGVAGARITGGGFGGCAICLVRENAVSKVSQAVAEYYHPVALPPDTRAEIWPVVVSDGARIIDGMQ